MMKNRLNALLWLQKINLFGLASIGMAVGLWLIIWPPGFLDKTIAASLGSSILSAVITSGIIGWFFQQRLAKDVFEASIGYLLPEELKPTLKWIYDQKFLCTRSNQQYQIESSGADTVRLRIQTIRTFKNIGKNTEVFYVGLAIDKGFSINYPSKITEFGYNVGDERYEKTETDLNNNEEGRTYTIDRIPVKVPPNKEIDTWHSFTLEKRLPDDEVVVFSYPSVNPEVFVRCDKNIKEQVTFAYGPDPNTVRRLGTGEYRLDGVLLPMQHIRVRWFLRRQTD